MASVRWRFFMDIFLLDVGIAHAPLINGIEKAAFHTKKAAASQRHRRRLPSPSLVDRRNQQFLSGRAKQAVLLARNPHAAAPSQVSSVTGRTSMQLCSSSQWRDRSGIAPDSLLSPRRDTCLLCSSHLYLHYINLYACLCQS